MPWDQYYKSLLSTTAIRQFIISSVLILSFVVSFYSYLCGEPQRDFLLLVLGSVGVSHCLWMKASDKRVGILNFSALTAKLLLLKPSVHKKATSAAAAIIANNDKKKERKKQWW